MFYHVGLLKALFLNLYKEMLILNIDIEVISRDKETLHMLSTFKTIKDKQNIADILAEKTVTAAYKSNNSVFMYYYGHMETDFLIKSCISLGLLNDVIEDFYIVKEVLGYSYVLKILRNADNYISVIK